MVTTEIARGLVKRLLLLPAQDGEQFGLTAVDVKRELVSAVQAFGKSDDHAERSINALLDEVEFRPTRAMIRRFFDQTAVTKASESKPECPHCAGSTFVTGWRLVTRRDGRVVSAKRITQEESRSMWERLGADQDIVSVGEPCVCRVTITPAATGSPPLVQRRGGMVHVRNVAENEQRAN